MDDIINNNKLEQKILVEQVRLLYKPSLPLIGVNLFISLVLVITLRDIFSHRLLVAWFCAMAIVMLYRYIILVHYRNRFQSDNAGRFAMYYIIGTGTTGVLWGFFSLFLFPEQSITHQFIAITVLIGLGAGAVTTYNIHLPSFFAFYLPTMIPICVKFFILDDITYLILSIALSLYTIYQLYYCIVLHRSHEESLRLRFENVDLIEQLREQKEEAERANLAKSKFLAAASHDLRQPLHALTLFTSVLNDSDQNPANRKVVGQIDASVQALESLFNALLDISRLDAGTMKVEKKSFLLQPVFDRLKNDFTHESSAKGLQLVFASCDEAVFSDPALLEQILRNFVSNAIRYTEKGEVRITCETHEGKLLITISDTGIGIPFDERDQIFNEFHQLNNPERDRSKGLGLGLAIVRRTANLLEHPITVQSEPGHGSVFSILVEPGNRNEVIEDIKPAVTDTAQSARSGLFIVIDDENSVRAGMQDRVKLWGYNIITAADQDEAMMSLRKSAQRPDGIIVDYRLRNNHTGIEAIRAIHAEFGDDIPALIITGDTAAEQLREVNNSGYQILHKPVGPAKLRTFLRNALKKG